MSSRSEKLGWKLVWVVTILILLPFFTNTHLFPFMRFGMFSFYDKNRVKLNYSIKIKRTGSSHFQKVNPEDIGIKNTYLEVWLGQCLDSPDKTRQLLKSVKKASLVSIDSLQIELTLSQGGSSKLVQEAVYVE